MLRDHGFAPALRELADQIDGAQLEPRRPARPRRRGRARQDGAGRALHDHPRADRAVGAARAADPHRRLADSAPDEGGVVATVVDDAEPERRRRTFETVESSACEQLHGELEVAPSRAPARRSGSRCRRTRRSARRPGADRATTIPADVRGKRQEQGLSAVRVVARRATRCASSRASRRRSGTSSRTATARSS